MNILYISKLDWFWTKQRPQHIVENLAISNKVDFFSIRPWRNDKNIVISHDVNNKDTKKSIININSNLSVYRKRVSPKRESFLGEGLSDLLVKRYVKSLINSNNYDIIICSLPHHHKYLPKNNNIPIIYDCMDDQVKISNSPEKASVEEKALLKKVDYVIASSDYIKEQLIKRYSFAKNRIDVINNAAEVKRFSEGYSEQSAESKIIGYVGSIDKWLDLEGIIYVASSLTDYNFKFYGPISKSMVNKIKSVPNNVEFCGSIPYENVPTLVNSFDVALMPFLNDKIVLAVNPVKIYEYLAMGKKVIANEYSETKKFGTLIKTYKSNKDFLMKLKQSLAEKDTQEVINKRLKFSKENTWYNRASMVEKICLNLMKEV
ncbi:glycosyl transferase [Latilactobacillus curvatus]|nr:glycosyl transferase [Latilactobacillus curvatus]